MDYECYASCSFGLEGILAKEIRDLGLGDVRTENALVRFRADPYGIARANIELRTADRVYIVLARFPAKTFDALFEGIKALPFEEWLPENAAFPTAGNAVQSTLMSVADIQSITKKAIVSALQRRYKTEKFPEHGHRYQIYANAFQDEFTIALNTSGAGLNRRGYRVETVAAPLRETLAAALVLIARWRWRDFYDPMCGGGTIVIEAAMIAADIAPGARRSFDAEWFSPEFEEAFAAVRREVRARERVPEMGLFASDVDPRCIEAARKNARAAGVADFIQFAVRDVAEFEEPEKPAAVVSNPPYAMRIGERQEVDELYRRMGLVFRPLPDTVCFFLTPSPVFERLYGQAADKKRKLYNGNVQCWYYQYFRKRH
ncbi:MAG: class I SAM-dependent RNA methyltransferase [Clostridia bacterium]|nr:class I SAM-dependent RNA methyltransferase [Clostridia bacterium]